MTAPDFNTFDPATEEARAAHIASTEEAMRANGVQVEEKIATVVGDYWAEPAPERFYFPDGKQYIEFKPMTESARAKYQNKTMTTMALNRASGDSKIGINVARDRRALIDVSVTGWLMYRGGEEVGFKNSFFGFEKWIEIADPKHIEGLEKAIRKANPWMASDMDPAEIKEEIKRLEELLIEVEDRRLGESVSSNK